MGEGHLPPASSWWVGCGGPGAREGSGVAVGGRGGGGGGAGGLVLAAGAGVPAAAGIAAPALPGATRHVRDAVPEATGPDWADDVLAGVGELVGRGGAA